MYVVLMDNFTIMTINYVVHVVPTVLPVMEVAINNVNLAYQKNTFSEQRADYSVVALTYT